MKELNLRELVKYKKLPFNIYNEKGHILMYTGDLLTPGKILELKEAKFLIYDENFEKKSLEARENPLVIKRKQQKESSVEYSRKFFNEIQSNEASNKNISDIPTYIKDRVNDYTVTRDLKINKKSVFSSELQLSLKEIYKDIQEELEVRNYPIAQTKFIKLMNLIDNELTKNLSSITHLSQLKLFGEYKNCHALNVALISAFIATKNQKINVDIKDVILSGLMHDIGKTRIDQNIAYKSVLYIPEQAEYEKHVIIGYKIVKEIFKLGNTIARPALEHHVMLDGSGFPSGLALDNITEISKIIAIINYYDKLTFNRTANVIEYNYEAGKILLNIGAKKYNTELIYDISNKYILNDTSKLSELIEEKAL